MTVFGPINLDGLIWRCLGHLPVLSLAVMRYTLMLSRTFSHSLVIARVPLSAERKQNGSQ